MSLYWITGSAGSGKTAVQTELTDKWFEAHDTDDPSKTGLAALHEKASGLVVAQYNEFNWGHEGISLDTHAWGITSAGLQRVADMAAEQDVFLAGRIREPSEDFLAKIDSLFFLELPNDILEQRLQQRAANAEKDTVLWGSEQWQIDFTLEQNPKLLEEYTAMGAVIINADQTTKEIVSDILAELEA